MQKSSKTKHQPKTIKKGESKMTEIQVGNNWLKAAYVEAKNHITPENLFDYAENSKSLTQKQKNEIAEHIASCDRCQKQFDKAALELNK